MTATVTVRSHTIGYGTDFQIIDWGILVDAEEVTNDVPRADRGVVPGRDGDGGRRLWFDVQLATDTASNMLDDFSDLEAAWARSDDEVALVIDLGTPEYTYLGRTRGVDGRSGVRLPARCEFLATDPRRFGAEQNATVGTDLTVANAGNRPTIWRWEIAGPVTNPTLSLGSDFTLTYTGTVSGGQTLVVSRRLGTAIKAGASVVAALSDQDGRTPARLVDLPVGTSSLGGTAAGEFYWRDAY